MARKQAKAAGGAHRAPGSGGHRKRSQAAPGAQRRDTAAHGRRRGPVRLLAYLRVSTRGQADNGISLKEQEARTRAYIEANGAELAGIEADRGLSGRTIRRPGLKRLLDRLRAGDADGVVVARLDRLSRSLRDAVNLFAKAEKEGWQIHSLNERLDTSSPGGRFVCHVLAAMAQWEREMAAERTREALSELKRQGRRVSGRPPLGYRFDQGRLVEVPGEQAIVRRLERLQAQGLGAKAVAARLNRRGVVNPRTGRLWHHGTVRDILARLRR